MLLELIHAHFEVNLKGSKGTSNLDVPEFAYGAYTIRSRSQESLLRGLNMGLLNLLGSEYEAAQGSTVLTECETYPVSFVSSSVFLAKRRVAWPIQIGAISPFSSYLNCAFSFSFSCFALVAPLTYIGRLPTREHGLLICARPRRCTSTSTSRCRGSSSPRWRSSSGCALEPSV